MNHGINHTPRHHVPYRYERNGHVVIADSGLHPVFAALSMVTHAWVFERLLRERGVEVRIYELR